MKRYHVRISGLLSAAALAIVLGVGSSAGIAHAEPGPRPTLTPIPPVAPPPADAPADVPAAAPPVAPREEPAAPTPTPRRMIMAVVTPIAPVRPTAAVIEPVAEAPIMVEGTNIQVRYVPAAEVAAAPQATTGNNATDGLMSYRSLLVSLIALDIMGICVLLRRRFATK